MLRTDQECVVCGLARSLLGEDQHPYCFSPCVCSYSCWCDLRSNSGQSLAGYWWGVDMVNATEPGHKSIHYLERREHDRLFE